MLELMRFSKLGTRSICARSEPKELEQYRSLGVEQFYIGYLIGWFWMRLLSKTASAALLCSTHEV